MVVSEIMSDEPLFARVSDRVGSLRAKLRQAGIRHMPVVEEGRLVGIVSDRDLPPLVFPRPEAGSDLDREGDRVSDIMSSDVFSVDPETDVDDVIDLMIEQRIGAVPVVEADSLRLVGIVSYIDVLRAAKGAL